jgi:hypothetical protein
MTQDKAQSAVNGYSLNKGCKAYRVLLTPLTYIHVGHAGLGHLGGSLRARREGIICGVASFVKDSPFTARRALQLIPSRHAETYILFDTLH